MSGASKEEVRKRIAGHLAAQSAEHARVASRSIVERITNHPLFSSANRVLVFLPMQGQHDEPDLSPLVTRATSSAKSICVPRVCWRSKSMDAITTGRLASVEHDKFGVPTPTGTDCLHPEDLDLILVPGVAFTRSGDRLGRGGGFYDRYLARTTATTVGVCFQCQVVPSLPTERHDARVDWIVTENALERCGP